MDLVCLRGWKTRGAGNHGDGSEAGAFAARFSEQPKTSGVRLKRESKTLSERLGQLSDQIGINEMAHSHIGSLQ
jgi:hypothetical protein